MKIKDGKVCIRNKENEQTNGDVMERSEHLWNKKYLRWLHEGGPKQHSNFDQNRHQGDKDVAVQH